jgi:hypothetical protein
MDDIDLHLRHGRHIAAMTRLLRAVVDDPAVTAANAGFLICDLDGADARASCLAAAAAIGCGETAGDQSRGVGDAGGAMPRFVQFCVDCNEIILDQPTTTLAMAEGERLLRERAGFRMERRMVPAVGSGMYFSESLIKAFTAIDHPNLDRRCHAAAMEAAWIVYELWGFDPQVPITVTAFSHAGGGQMSRLNGSLRQWVLSSDETSRARLGLDPQ